MFMQVFVRRMFSNYAFHLVGFFLYIDSYSSFFFLSQIHLVIVCIFVHLFVLEIFIMLHSNGSILISILQKLQIDCRL